MPHESVEALVEAAALFAEQGAVSHAAEALVEAVEADLEVALRAVIGEWGIVAVVAEQFCEFFDGKALSVDFHGASRVKVWPGRRVGLRQVGIYSDAASKSALRGL